MVPIKQEVAQLRYCTPCFDTLFETLVMYSQKYFKDDMLTLNVPGKLRKHTRFRHWDSRRRTILRNRLTGGI